MGTPNPTWHSKETPDVSARLDMIFADRGLVQALQKVTHSALTCTTSDHSSVTAEFKFQHQHWTKQYQDQIDWKLENKGRKDKFVQALETAMLPEHTGLNLKIWMDTTHKVIR